MAAKERPFQIGASLFVITIALAHVEWLLKVEPVLAGLREVSFLLSTIALVWSFWTAICSRPSILLTLATISCLGLVVVSWSVDQLVVDLSADTLTSHYELVRSISFGVNPYFEPEVEGSLDEYSVLGVSFHMLSAIGFNIGLTRNPFILPYIHMTLLVSTALMTWGREYFSRTNLILMGLLTPLVFPTFAQQFLTGYRDGYSGLAVLTCVVVTVLGWTRRLRSSSFLLLALALSAVLPSIKLSLVPTAFLLGATCVAGVVTRNRRAFFRNWWMMIVLAVTITLWIFPTIFALFTTNEASRSLLSTEAITRTWSGSSEVLQQMNIFEEFGSLLFGVVEGNPDTISWSLPFQVPSSSELIEAGRPDPRVAGFGPWFGEAFIFAILTGISTVLAIKRGPKLSGVANQQGSSCQTSENEHRIYLWIAAILIFSFFLTPFRFNSRYVVQLYVFCMLLLALSMMSDQSRNKYALLARGTRFASIAILVVNSLIAWYGSTVVSLENRRLTMELIDNYVNRVDESPSGVKYSIVTGGKRAIRRYLPSQTPKGRVIIVDYLCDPDISTRVYWLGDDIGICQYNVQE